MVGFITGICVLMLSICQLKEAKMPDSVEFDVQKDSLMQMTGSSEADTSRNHHHVKRIAEQPAAPRNCDNGISCNGEFITTPNIRKPCAGSFPCKNEVRTKIFKEILQRTRRKVSPVKQISDALVLTTQCPPENPRCEQTESLSTNAKVFYQCPTGLRCATEKNTRLKRPKRKTLRLGGTLRASKTCTFGLKCLENDKVGMSTKGSMGNDEKTKAKNDDTSETVRLDCPIGLWCVMQQKRDYENSATLEQCPPGLWCKRNGIQTIQDILTKKKAAKRCPDGLRCSSKREEGYENFESLDQCPPGLWCKRDEVKRKDNSVETTTDQPSCPTGFKCSSKREEGFEKSPTLRKCPPGLWCKRDTSLVRDDITESHGIRKYCKNGVECFNKRLVDGNKSVSFDQCPPGLWCKRSSPEDHSILKEQSSIQTKKGRDCSSGPWCAIKRDLSSTPRRMLKPQHVSSERGDDYFQEL